MILVNNLKVPRLQKRKKNLYTVQKHRKEVHDCNGKLLILRFYVLGKLEEKNCFVMYLIQNNIVTLVQDRKKKQCRDILYRKQNLIDNKEVNTGFWSKILNFFILSSNSK